MQVHYHGLFIIYCSMHAGCDGWLTSHKWLWAVSCELWAVSCELWAVSCCWVVELLSCWVVIGMALAPELCWFELWCGESESEVRCGEMRWWTVVLSERVQGTVHTGVIVIMMTWRDGDWDWVRMLLVVSGWEGWLGLLRVYSFDLKGCPCQNSSFSLFSLSEKSGSHDTMLLMLWC
jgi:hypothetical protein